jgi:hypothetical protein
MYDLHLKRISSRPGEKFQKYLHGKWLTKFLGSIKEHGVVEKILEVGPGGGRLAVEILTRGFNYSCIEPTQSMLSLTKEKIDKAFLGSPDVKYYGEKLPKISNKLTSTQDAVVMIHVLEHADNPTVAFEWLSAIKTTLNSCGFLFIISPDYRDYGVDFFDCDWTHSYPTTLNNVVEIVEESGFEVIVAKAMRSWISNPIGKLPLMIIRRILPIRAINWIGSKTLNHDLLGTGLASSLFYRNLFIVAKIKKN